MGRPEATGGNCETTVMCPIVVPTRSPPGPPGPRKAPAMLLLAEGMTGPASTCISAVSSLATE
jgi:hypothetical protein